LPDVSAVEILITNKQFAYARFALQIESYDRDEAVVLSPENGGERKVGDALDK
jgi:hypothetical protein